ncbi:MAG TPA: ATP-binding protein, partial [Armatimonadetes bacterium]|nr:ATP-binding protein [Armatimonadota bacterium]
VEISVEDTGPGIPPEERALVFERFYKSRGRGGVGLGLAIAKRVVESHGGRIWVEGHDRGGARFVVRLPK